MGLLTVNFRPPPVLDKIIKDLQQPFAGKAGVAALKAIRTGPGSLDDQLKSRATVSGRGQRESWPKRRGGPFRQSKTGRLRRAWLGGSGGVERIKGNALTVGLDERALPYAGPAQRRYTSIKLTPKMRVYLGKIYGVWAKKRARVVTIPGSPVSLNRQILDRVAEAIFSEATGQAVRR